MNHASNILALCQAISEEAAAISDEYGIPTAQARTLATKAVADTCNLDADDLAQWARILS